MITNKFTRVAEDDPNRCQAVHPGMQCPFRATGDFVDGQWQGSKYCPRHGGTSQLTAAKREEKRMYLSAKWQEKIGRQVDHPKIKSLAEEVGIIRMTIEAKLESCKDDKDLLMSSHSLVSLVSTVKDLVKIWQHVEERTGQVLDRSTMNVFVSDLLEILMRYIDDPEILQMIGEDIEESLNKLMSPLNAQQLANQSAAATR